MNIVKKISSIVLSMLLLLVATAPICFAVDAAAPAAQSVPWTAEDYLRAALSGAAGGLISGLVALVISWMNNRNALKFNQQKIDADKEALEKNYKQQIEKICYEEKRKLCGELLAMMSKFTLTGRDFNIIKVSKAYARTSLICGFRYGDYVSQNIEMIVNDRILRKHFSGSLKGEPISPQENERYQKRVQKYAPYYDVLVVITQKMLAGEELLPPTEWNLDDFEGSVPLEYRKLIS